jgi:hypothetical protein
VSEATAAFGLASVPVRVGEGVEDPKLLVLKWAHETDPRTGASRNEPNEPGSDFLALEPSTETLVYIDDKAWRARGGADAVDSVPALTRNLAGNMVEDAGMLRRRLRAMREAGLDVDPAAERAAGRLDRAAEEIRRAFPEGFDLARDGRRLREILRRRGILLGVTNALERGRGRVSDDLAAAGVQFVETPLP